MQHVFRRSYVKHGIHHALLAIDFENDPLTGDFICAGLHGKVRERKVTRIGSKLKTTYPDSEVDLYFDDQQACLDYLASLKAHSCMIVTFNLSYDRVFLDSLIDHSTLLEVNARVITAQLRNKIKVIDLANHVDGSLEKWIGYLKMEKNFGIRKESLSNLKARVINDARATYRLGDFLENFYYHELGIPLMLTTGACALKLLSMKFFEHHWFRDNDYISNFERQGYYGGRVEVFKRGEQMTHGYDVNSMYLSIMRNNLFPDPITVQHFQDGHKDWRRYFDNYLGIWEVTVCSPPDINIGALPFRLKGKLIFPKGVFRGTWTSVELKEAESLGYEILEIHEFCIYRHCHHYFTRFADFVWAKRLEYRAKGNKGMDQVIKKLGNSLYGKLAQRNGDGYFGRVSDYKGKIEGNYKFIEYRGETYLQLSPDTRTDAKHTFPCISAFVASYARIMLLRAIKANEGNIIYCDTDSIKTTQPAIGVDIGEGLGQWTYEIKGKLVNYYRPKFYGNKRKGVPSRAVKLESSPLGERWQYDKPLRYREAIKKGDIPNRWVTIIKELTFADDKRWWFNGEGEAIELTIQTPDDHGSINILAIPVEARYKEKLKVSTDRDQRSDEDRRAAELERLDKRRNGIRF